MAVLYSLPPSVHNRGTQPGANIAVPCGTTRCAIARVRLPSSTPTRRLLLGAMAVHPQEGERSRRLLAASSLLSPALNARSTAYTSSSCGADPQACRPTGPDAHDERARRLCAVNNRAMGLQKVPVTR